MIDISFEKNPITGDILKVKNDVSIKQSIKVLLLTHFNERPFQEGKGSRLNRLMFKMKSEELKERISEEIREVIDLYEPRANIIAVQFSDKIESNDLKVTIFFTILNSLDVNTVDVSLVMDVLAPPPAEGPEQ